MGSNQLEHKIISFTFVPKTITYLKINCAYEMQDPYAQAKCHLEKIFEEPNNEKYTIFTNSKTYC